MEIVVTSDCHGRSDILKKIYAKHPKADLYLDAGDSECREEDLDPFITVKGNCDYMIQTKFRVIEAEGIRIYLFHGNSIPLSLDSLSRLAKANMCQMIIHGHTHIPLSMTYNDVAIVCPGSVTIPRSTKGKTYCLISLSGNRIEEISFHKADL